VVGGDGDVHVRRVVCRARAANDDLDEANDDEADKERGDLSGRGRRDGEGERDGDGEPDAAVAGHLERLEEEPGYREKEGVEAEGYRGVEGP
jgi:hypothetical protein